MIKLGKADMAISEDVVRHLGNVKGWSCDLPRCDAFDSCTRHHADSQLPLLGSGISALVSACQTPVAAIALL